MVCVAEAEEEEEEEEEEEVGLAFFSGDGFDLGLGLGLGLGLVWGEVEVGRRVSWLLEGWREDGFEVEGGGRRDDEADSRHCEPSEVDLEAC